MKISTLLKATLLSYFLLAYLISFFYGFYTIRMWQNAGENPQYDLIDKITNVSVDKNGLIKVCFRGILVGESDYALHMISFLSPKISNENRGSAINEGENGLGIYEINVPRSDIAKVCSTDLVDTPIPIVSEEINPNDYFDYLVNDVVKDVVGDNLFTVYQFDFRPNKGKKYEGKKLMLVSKENISWTKNFKKISIQPEIKRGSFTWYLAIPFTAFFDAIILPYELYALAFSKG